MKIMKKTSALRTSQKIYTFFKRTGDIICSLLVFIFFGWLILLLMLLVKCTSKGPVFFRQVRLGLDKKPFRIFKFRTMKIDTPKDVPTHLLENPDQYITKIGRFLRKTSLDEVPQVFNIFAGQMSVIGPRPCLPNQEDLIAEREAVHANDVKPGLSGMAQVYGRDTLPINEKARLDGEYVKKMSFWLDIKLIILTAFTAFRGKGEVEGKQDNDDKK